MTRLAAGREPAGQEPAGREPAGREPAGREAAGRQPTGRDAAGRQPTGRGATGIRRDLAGTWGLVRLALRRDRIMLPIWIVVFAGTAASVASATVGLYPDAAPRIAAAQSWNRSTSLIALHGRIYDPDSLGSLAVVKLSGLYAAFVAVLAIILTVRHTRAEEEAGRLEMLGATAVGRRAPLTAALIVSVGTFLALGALTSLGLMAAGLPAAGSVAFGLAWASVGICFAAVAAVTAQLSTSARGAVGLAVAVLGLVYALRAIGDTAERTGARWLTWLSPIGWGQQFRPYAGNRWWVLLITFGFTAVATAGAYALVARRDMGAGLVPQRPGPAEAAARLRGPFALAWRLQRATLLAWVCGFALAGALFGNLTTTVTGFADSEQAREMITRLGGEKALVDAYLAAMLGILGVIAAAYGVQAAARLRSEETTSRLECLLATATSRGRWALSHVAVAAGGSALLMATAGGTAGVAYAARTGESHEFAGVFVGALAQVPAAWALIGIVVAGFGLVPRLAVVGWVAFGGFVLLGEFGPLLKLPQAVMDVSPFAHVPRLPGSHFSAVPLIWLLAVALALTGAGIAGLRRRDIPVT